MSGSLKDIAPGFFGNLAIVYSVGLRVLYARIGSGNTYSNWNPVRINHDHWNFPGHEFDLA